MNILETKNKELNNGPLAGVDGEEESGAPAADWDGGALGSGLGGFLGTGTSTGFAPAVAGASDGPAETKQQQDID